MRSQTKKSLILVRHGESEYNSAMRRGSTYVSPLFWLRGADPGIPDARLTKTGREQAARGHKQLADLFAQRRLGADNLLVVTSPLRRAVETMEIMMGASKAQQEAGGGVFWDFTQKKALALPEAREITFSTSDCGVLPENLRTLQERFGSIVDFASELDRNKARLDSSSVNFTRGFDDRWWLPESVVKEAVVRSSPSSSASGYRPGLPGLARLRHAVRAYIPTVPLQYDTAHSSIAKQHDDSTLLDRDSIGSDSVSRDSVSRRLRSWQPKILFQRIEPKHDVANRVVWLQEWLLGRPEEHVILFGHSMFWKHFSNSEGKLKNCQIMTCELSRAAAGAEGGPQRRAAGEPRCTDVQFVPQDWV